MLNGSRAGCGLARIMRVMDETPIIVDD